MLVTCRMILTSAKENTGTFVPSKTWIGHTGIGTIVDSRASGTLTRAVSRGRFSDYLYHWLSENCHKNPLPNAAGNVSDVPERRLFAHRNFMWQISDQYSFSRNFTERHESQDFDGVSCFEITNVIFNVIFKSCSQIEIIIQFPRNWLGKSH